MEAKVIVISNQKGGTGKTALSFEIGTILSKNHKVLFVDLDGQTDLTSMLINHESEPLRGGALEALEGTVNARNLIVNINSHVDILPGTESLLNADYVLMTKGGRISERLSNALEPIKKDYDYIVIDTPPKLGVVTTNALSAADYVFIPTLAEVKSIDGALRFIKTFQEMEHTGKTDALLSGIIVNRFNGRSIINRSMYGSIEDIARQLNTRVFVIKDTVKIREAHFFGRSVTQESPKIEVSRELVEVVNYIEDLERTGSN